MDRRTFFDKVASSWDNRPEAEGLAPRLERVVALARVQPGNKVLDVGTGTGVLLPYLLQAVGESGIVVAIDISRPMLCQAVQRVVAPNLFVVATDMQQAGLRTGSFDCAICNAVFPHFERKQEALAELWRVLRTGGMLVISHPIGREAVNRLHAQHGAVGQDRVPSAPQMRQLLEELGWREVEVIDEPHFYLAWGRKG